jgi:hypothetical protein
LRSGVLTRVVVHVLQHVGDRSLALSVHAASKLADEADLLVVAQPLGSCYKTLGTDGGGNTKWRGARAIGVKVPVSCQHSASKVDVQGALLVHLVDQFVLRVGKRSHQVTVEMVSFSFFWYMRIQWFVMTYALVLPSVPLEVVHVQAPVQARKH